MKALDSGGFITASGDLLTAAGDLVLCGEQHNDVPMTQSSEHQEPVIDSASMLLYYSSDHSEPSLVNRYGSKVSAATQAKRDKMQAMMQARMQARATERAWPSTSPGTRQKPSDRRQ